jgi:hypothetical protein
MESKRRTVVMGNAFFKRNNPDLIRRVKRVKLHLAEQAEDIRVEE